MSTRFGSAATVHAAAEPSQRNTTQKRREHVMKVLACTAHHLSLPDDEGCLKRQIESLKPRSNNASSQRE